MSSNLKNFIVLLPSGRRQTMKVEWDSPILKILEDVCKKHGLKSEEYDLKHLNTVLDPSTVIRFSSLPNNAFLEMIPCRQQRKVSPVTVSVQVDTKAERLTGDFMPNVDLENILQNLCPEVLSDKSQVPVVVFMRREVVGFNRISSTTLQELGVTSGRILLRVTLRESEKHPELQLIGSAMLNPVKSQCVEEDSVNKSSGDEKIGEKNVEHDQQSSCQDSTTAERIPPSSRHENTPLNRPDEKLNVKITEKLIVEKTSEQKEKEPKKPPVVENLKRVIDSKKSIADDAKLSTPKVVNNSCAPVTSNEPSSLKDIDLSSIKYIDENRKMLIFHLKDENPTIDDLPDDFFEATVDDIRLMMRDLKRKREEMENTPLLTASLREKEAQRKMEQYNETVIRVQFPDRYILQGVFKPTDTLAEVIQCVKQSLKHPNIDFYLYTSPPKRVLLPEETLFSTDCVPCAKIYFGTNAEIANKGYLEEHLYTLMTSRSLASIVACQSRNIRPNTSLRREAKEDSASVSGQACVQQSNRQPCTTAQSTDCDQSITKRTNSKEQSKSKENVPKWFKPV